MSILVTDRGFSRPEAAPEFSSPDSLPAGGARGFAVDLSPDADPAALAGRLDDIALVRVDFPSFADGRGLTIARRLRLMGYRGRLRAHGHVLADQYAMARRAGFDEVEIPDALAARQPEDQWRARANWRDHDYQRRVRG